MTYAQCRTQFGKSTVSKPSRFIKEIPEALIANVTPERKRIELSDSGSTPSFAPVNLGFKISVDSMKKEGASFCKGDNVSHKKFGKGTIIDVKSVGTDQRLEIEFEGIGKKSLMAAYANLTKL